MYLILIIRCPVCVVIYFEINLGFLVKSFFYGIKKPGQKCLKNILQYLKNVKSF